MIATKWLQFKTTCISVAVANNYTWTLSFQLPPVTSLLLLPLFYRLFCLYATNKRIFSLFYNLFSRLNSSYQPSDKTRKRFKMPSNENTQITFVIIFSFYLLSILCSVCEFRMWLQYVGVCVSVCVWYQQIGCCCCGFIRWMGSIVSNEHLVSHTQHLHLQFHSIEVMMFGSSAIFTNKSFDNTCDATHKRVSFSPFNSNRFFSLSILPYSLVCTANDGRVYDDLNRMSRLKPNNNKKIEKHILSCTCWLCSERRKKWSRDIESWCKTKTY